MLAEMASRWNLVQVCQCQTNCKEAKALPFNAGQRNSYVKVIGTMSAPWEGAASLERVQSSIRVKEECAAEMTL